MPEQKFVCQCHGREFTVKNKYTTHVWYHSQQPVICPHCNRTFSKESILRTHLKRIEEGIIKSKYLDPSELIKLYEEGMPTVEIAKKFEVSRGTILSEFKRVGYKPEANRFGVKGFIELPEEEQERIRKEKNKELDRQNYLKNKEKMLANRRNWGLKNKEHVATLMKEWNQENEEHVSNYKEENKEVQKIRNNLWRQTPNGKACVKAARHRRRKVDDDLLLNTSLVKQVYERNIKIFGVLTCELCFKPILNNDESLEHLFPVCREEEFPNVKLNSLENLGISHLRCNQKKNHRTLEEWFQKYPEYSKLREEKNAFK
jgi:transposase-like protein